MIMNILISSLSLADSVTKPKMFCKMNERNVFLSYMSATLFQKFNFKKSLKSIICKLILQTDCIQKASFGVLSQLCNLTERQTRASKIYKLRNLSTVIICHFFFALRQKFHFAVAARLFLRFSYTMSSFKTQQNTLSSLAIITEKQNVKEAQKKGVSKNTDRNQVSLY